VKPPTQFKVLFVGVLLLCLWAVLGCKGPEYVQPPVAQPRPAATGPTVVIGDSIMMFWDMPCGWINKGKGHDRTRMMLERFQRDVLDLRPAKVVLGGGVNDIRDKQTDQQYIARMIHMAQAAGAVVYVLTVTPTDQSDQVADWNAGLRYLAAAYGVAVIDVYTPLVGADGLIRGQYFWDGLHLVQDGYDILDAQAVPVVGCGA
jgi:hypothetical protein